MASIKAAYNRMIFCRKRTQRAQRIWDKIYRIHKITFPIL